MAKKARSLNVFTDFHHGSLLQSLILLFEGRLGGNVYRPIGLEWHQEGYWAIFNHPDTAAQFLTTAQGYRPVDGTPPVNLIQEVRDFPKKPQQKVYYCRDIDSGQVNKGIDFETFKNIPIDIVIASVPQHVEPFKELIRLYHPQAKLIFQIGNAWTIEAAQAPNIMASAIIDDIPDGINFVQYHQEFKLSEFYPEPDLEPGKNIYSFVNVFQNFIDYNFFLELERSMSDWNFKIFGGQNRDGAIGPASALAAKMREAMFVCHLKAGGDGYGHIIFNSAAAGVPLITKKQYYQGKMGEKLMIDGETCINIDDLDTDQAREKILHFSDPLRYQTMRENVYTNFKEQVDFDRDFVKIKEFLACLK